jgi:hypothetical protein
MFRSKTRQLIFPQSEHARLAGAIALLWGNDTFAKPALPFASFVAGVTLHDHGHGYFDLNEIGGMEPAESLASTQRLVNHHLDDPIADTVAHFHALRLLQGGAWPQLIGDCERKIADGIKNTQISRDQYLWADKITELCDSIAFVFCFDQPSNGALEVSPRQGANETVTIRFTIDQQGKIVIEPWPLRVDGYEGFIFAYAADGYPTQLKPMLVDYMLCQR